MSTNKTPNLQLHSWEPTDAFRRQEFNENFTAIDTAYGNTEVTLKALHRRALGVPVLARNMYNLFMKQKAAGQDVSWMEGIVYDDFTDQSKIESLGTGMSYSASEKCVVFKPTNASPNATMVTKALPLNFSHTCALVLVRYDTFYVPGVEVWDDSTSNWVSLSTIEGTRHEHDLSGSNHYYEYAFLAPTSYSRYNIKLRLTLRTLFEETAHLYNYCYMIC